MERVEQQSRKIRLIGSQSSAYWQVRITMIRVWKEVVNREPTFACKVNCEDGEGRRIERRVPA